VGGGIHSPPTKIHRNDSVDKGFKSKKNMNLNSPGKKKKSTSQKRRKTGEGEDDLLQNDSPHGDKL